MELCFRLLSLLCVLAELGFALVVCSNASDRVVVFGFLFCFDVLRQWKTSLYLGCCLFFVRRLSFFDFQAFPKVSDRVVGVVIFLFVLGLRSFQKL